MKYDDSGKHEAALASVGDPRFYLSTFLGPGKHTLSEWDQYIEEQRFAVQVEAGLVCPDCIERGRRINRGYICEVCGDGFQAKRRARYCSSKCRQRAYNSRSVTAKRTPMSWVRDAENQ